LSSASKPAAPLTKPDAGQDSGTFVSNPKDALARIGREAASAGTDLSEKLIQQFKKHMIPLEDDRDVVYRDSLGRPTVGIGHLVTPADKLKVGDRISAAQKEAFWRQDAARALTAALQQMNAAGVTDPDFIFPLGSVNFQLGLGWRGEFKKTWAFIMQGDYEAAAREVQNSVWYKQSPNRVKDFQDALRALPPKSKPGR
jgi:GH24 family phage-related lysozyme (muramidase)